MGNELLGMLEIALGIAKDKAFYDALAKVQKAQREYLMAKADSERARVNGIINSMVELDLAADKLEFEYQRIQNVLSLDAKMRLEDILARLRLQREVLNREKNVRNRAERSVAKRND